MTTIGFQIIKDTFNLEGLRVQLMDNSIDCEEASVHEIKAGLELLTIVPAALTDRVAEALNIEYGPEQYETNNTTMMGEDTYLEEDPRLDEVIQHDKDLQDWIADEPDGKMNFEDWKKLRDGLCNSCSCKLQEPNVVLDSMTGKKYCSLTCSNK